MACRKENATSWKMRECNSVIRNQNHILKCTLKTLLDNPTRTRERALNSLIGLCRKECNGPKVEQPRPKRIMSLPVIVPIHYSPVCPPPIVVKRSDKDKLTKKAEEKKSSLVLKKRSKPFKKLSNKPVNAYGTRNSKQCCICCNKCCCCVTFCPPQPKCSSKKDCSQELITSRGLGASNMLSIDYCNAGRNSAPSFSSRKSRHSVSQNNERCSRRCCIPQQARAPLTMSPLCCPPPVKALSPKPANKIKCSPIVRSFRCTPPPVGKKKQKEGRQSISPSRNRGASSSRPYSAPGASFDISDICKNNIDFSSYYPNVCRNNNDSEVDPPGVYTAHSSTYGSPDFRTGSLFGSNTPSVNSQTLISQAFMEKMKGTSQGDNFFIPSEHPSPTARSASDDPFSITTWKTSKPVRFAPRPLGKHK